MNKGQKSYSNPPNTRFAWAFVQDGDVFAVPEPHALAMMLAGLGGVGFLIRRRKR